MELQVNTSPSPSIEVQQETKLPWQTPTVTEFPVADVTHATFAGVGGDGGTYS